MTIQVTGKNVDAGDAFKSYIVDKLSGLLDKYVGPEISGHIRLEKERNKFRTHCSIRLRTGLLMEAQGEAADAYASADAALEHLEKRVRRYKRRLKSHHNGRSAPGGRESLANDYVVQVDGEQEVTADDSEGPVIIAESERGILELAVSEAVMQLDLTQSSFMVFRNAGHGGLNVVYRRDDGNIGWIDPRPGTDNSLNGAGE